MARLPDVSTADLHQQLDVIDEKVPAQRVLAAIAYKQGESVGQLADRHAVTRQTIRNWLDRFREQPIHRAPFDDDRSGRPAKLGDAEREQFFDDLQSSPEAAGYDREVWVPVLAADHLESTYGVSYSLRHVRRLMHEASLSWQTGRLRHTDTDPENESNASPEVRS